MAENIMKRKSTILFSLILLLAVVLSSATIDTEIQQSKIKRDAFSKKIKEKRDEIIASQSKLSEAEREYYNLQNEIQEIDVQIRQTELEIEDKMISIDVKQREVEIANLNVTNQNKKLRRRLRTMYMFGETGYMEILLQADSLMNMLTRIDRIQSLLDYDKKLLAELKTAKKDLEASKKVLENEKEDLEVLKEQELNEKAQLGRALERAEVLKKELQKNVENLKLEKRLFEAEQEEITRYIKTLEKRKTYVGGNMGWPLAIRWNHISSFFGPRRAPTPGATTNHGAIDIVVPSGNPVYAAQTGTVQLAKYLGSYGNFVLIDHGGGIQTAYAHNSVLLVKPGQVVQRGQKVALSGTTGRSTGPHLHFEVRRNGTRVDPLNYVVIP